MHLVLELPVIGELCNWTALISACICIALYAVVWSGNERGRILARIAFGITVVMVTAGSTALMALILLQRYDVEYVVSYTSRELPLFYRITAFWAGQEGSLLLWALCSFIVGAILLWRLSKRDERQWEAPTMLFFVCAQLFMLALLVAKSPFGQLPHALPDGRGLNPLLQDPWMGIHPPLVLAGYALLSIPFACALSMMALREYEGELQEMRRWLLLGWCVLGAGIIVGGYWAYRVLGWGGYWGWDPVENASLVPWLTATALLHGLLLQRRAGALIRMNSILSIITYVLVIYATFLTRNSALEGASVHSFAQTKPLVYQLLLAFMVAYFIGGVGMVIWRWRDMPAKPAYSSPRSLNFAVWCGMLTLLTMAVWIEFGTSLPLLNPLLREPVRVAPSFFNRTTAPLALLLALLLSGGLWLGLKNWRIPTVVIPLSLTGLLTILSFIFGIRNPYYLMLFCIAFLIIAVNFVQICKVGIHQWRRWGGWLTHIGVGLMLMGIVTSAGYSRAKMLEISPMRVGVAFGYKFKYKDSSSKSTLKAGKRMQRDKSGELRLIVQRGGQQFEVRPVMFDSDYGKVRRPHIRYELLSDLYISPVAVGEGEMTTQHYALYKGQTKEIEGLQIRFVRFEVSAHSEGFTKDAIAKAILEVRTRKDGKKFQIAPGLTFSGKPVPAKLPNNFGTIHIASINADEGMIIIHIDREDVSQSLDNIVIEVSIKPLINLLRLGTVLLLLGGLLATVSTFAKASSKRQA